MKKNKSLYLILIIILAVIGFNLYYQNKTEEKDLTNNTELIEQPPDLEEDKNEPEPELEQIGIDLTDYEIPSVEIEKANKEFKVLIIEIDPVLTKGTIQGVNCKGKTASECLGQNKKQVVDELIDDLNTSSNNNLDVKIVKTEKINEFATYTKEVNLLNNKTAYRFDEDTWLDIMKDGWYTGISDSRIQKIMEWVGTYDYDYIIDKLNLIERRNNNEFDEVWLVNVDPTLAYESVMIGSNAFWINGKPILKDCQPFKMINVSISRPDANFECFGHATEQLLDKVFQSTYWPNYNPLNWSNNSITINEENYKELNLFQKFMLTENENTNKNSGYTGVGNIHFSPNSTKDYDWNNKNGNIYSKYNEWTNYPNITNDKSITKFNSNIYLNKKISGTKSDARLHHRWWFGLLPHHTGLTSDGYSNNWWDYYRKNTYITNIVSDEYTQNFNVGDKISISLILEYSDGTKEKIEVSLYDQNIEIDNKDLFYVDTTGQIYARKSGKANFVYYRDGVYGEINIIVN